MTHREDTAHNTTREKNLKDFGAFREDRELESVLEHISSISSLAAPIMLFPDLYWKKKTEAPASLAVATRNTIVPNLTAPSLGCSMGLITTSLMREEMNMETIRAFYDHMLDELGHHYSVMENIFVWIGLKKRKLLYYDLTILQFEDIIKRGAKAAVERYNLPKEILKIFDHGGSLYTEEELSKINLHDILPRSSFTNGRHDLGYGFKGNHFLEIQYVEEILDKEVAEKLDLKEGQIVIAYHGGGGMVPYHVGRYYGNRLKNTWKQKFFQYIGKTFFHFFSFKGIKYTKERFKYYFKRTPFLEIPLHATEGKRLMNATKASLNYSYAFNVAIYRRVIDALKKTRPGKAIEPKLIVAKIHNSILEENGMIVHRHTVVPIAKDGIALISGHNTTSSYIVRGLQDAEYALNSVDHGAGSVIERYEKNGTSKELSGYRTTIFKTKEPYEKEVTHITDEGIDYVIGKLEENGIAQRAVRLTPIATFKG